ncbi:hypothetical protein ABIF65_011811 [Bradyrhizobium japonicum]
MTSAIGFSIDNTDLPRLLADCVKSHLFHSSPNVASSWDELWTYPRYFDVYRIGDVEEVFKFNRTDIDRAVDAMAAACAESVPLSSDDHPIDIGSFVTASIEKAKAFDMDIVEEWVRTKHALPSSKFCSENAREVVKSYLQYGFEKRSNTKRTLGSHFVFAFVVPLAEKATDENCVIVEDCQPEEFERAASMCNPDSMSHLDDKSRANAAKYGFRLYDYERRFVH